MARTAGGIALEWRRLITSSSVSHGRAVEVGSEGGCSLQTAKVAGKVVLAIMYRWLKPAQEGK